MGCSWFTYAGTFEEIKEGWLLIPDYAQEWAGTDKLRVKRGRDRADFEMAETPHDNKSFTNLSGHLLIGVFKKLYNGNKVDVSLKDCYFKEYNSLYENKKLEDLRAYGILSQAGWEYEPYSLKITKDESLTYETCKYYSPSGQNSFMDKDDPDYEDFFDQKVYDEYWNEYFGHIK